MLKEFIVIRGDSTTGKRVENIRFENFNFEVPGYQLPPQGNEAMQAASPIGATVTLDFADNISFQNCEVAHTGNLCFLVSKGLQQMHCQPLLSARSGSRRSKNRRDSYSSRRRVKSQII